MPTEVTYTARHDVLLSPFREVHFGEESVAIVQGSTVVDLQNTKVLQVSAMQTSLFDLNQWFWLQ
jgi:hypothetical protein